MDWLFSVFYGFISGLGLILPVSVEAHDYFLELMTNIETNRPWMQFGIHVAVLAALCLFQRHRLAHIYREMRLASVPARRRKRQPDMIAVLDGRVVLTMLIPAGIGLLLTGFISNRSGNLPMVSLLLLISGVVIYCPHFLQIGNRDSRHLSRLEAIFYGIFAGLSAFPGVSRTGMILSAGALRGCGRTYLLDLTCLLLIPLLILMVIMDLFAVLVAGTAITLVQMLQYFLCAITAFGGASLAIASMRFLAVNRGYIVFSYYNWGMSILGFILYLMI